MNAFAALCVFVACVLAFAWASFWSWLGDKFESDIAALAVAFGGTFMIPMIVIALLFS